MMDTNQKHIKDFVNKYKEKGLSQKEVEELLYPGIVIAMYKMAKNGMIDEKKMKELESKVKEQQLSLEELGDQKIGKGEETLSDLLLGTLSKYVERLDKKLENL